MREFSFVWGREFGVDGWIGSKACLPIGNIWMVVILSTILVHRDIDNLNFSISPKVKPSSLDPFRLRDDPHRNVIRQSGIWVIEK